eukprot:gene9879-2201_t
MIKTLTTILIIVYFTLCSSTKVKEQCISSDHLRFCTFLNFTVSNSIYPKSLDETAELTYKREIKSTLFGKSEACFQQYKYALCRSLFFKCHNNELIRPCAHICYHFEQQCGSHKDLLDCGEAKEPKYPFTHTDCNSSSTLFLSINLILIIFLLF